MFGFYTCKKIQIKEILRYGIHFISNIFGDMLVGFVIEESIILEIMYHDTFVIFSVFLNFIFYMSFHGRWPKYQG